MDQQSQHWQHPINQGQLLSSYGVTRLVIYLTMSDKRQQMRMRLQNVNRCFGRPITKMMTLMTPMLTFTDSVKSRAQLSFPPNLLTC